MTKLEGKILIRGKVETLTGLHIGGSSTGLEIGGVDSVIIRDPVTNRPYIPGSSLKGGMRSLLERTEGKKFNKRVGRSHIHMCEDAEAYQKCNVCRIFGVTADSIEGAMTLTRLIVRDAKLADESAKLLESADTDLPYTDVKTEVVIDRITSAANPRQLERVPAGAKFEFEMVFNVYDPEDKKLLKSLFEAMCLLEDDYLGGQGSRGYGRIKFADVKMDWRSREYYLNGDEADEKKGVNNDHRTPKEIKQNFDEIVKEIEIGTAG